MKYPERTPEVQPYPFGEPHLLHLDPRYATLRDAEGLCPVDLGDLGPAWLCSRYADVRRLLTDPRFDLTPPTEPTEPTEPPPTAALSPAQVTRVTKAGLKPRQIERLRPLARTLAGELIHRPDHREGPAEPSELPQPTDLMATFVKPLAAAVVCELLDVPPADRTDVRAYLLGAAGTTTPPSEAEKQDRRALTRYLTELTAARSAAASGTADDLLSSMIRTRGEGAERLTDRQLVTVALRLLLPGLQNMVLMLANFVCALACHRSELERLRLRPDLVPSAVEELIRFTPFHSTSTFPRYAAEDVEIGGTLIRRGEVAVGALCAANRDERAFPGPDTFDVRRGENPHLGFGMGSHHCPGAALARLYLQEAIGALARRTDDLRVLRPETGARGGNERIVGWFDALPASWSARG
ncbi:cytochrome P450 [Kitasatospora mediocidica]|uniref:cytochrome P450 n=1 Tax=Kitasatospora mediocidica TaxID=58352 RepID=UPI00068EBE70|nr:cytochrome P450 [Kitasatospora mediocidica]